MTTPCANRFVATHRYPGGPCRPRPITACSFRQKTAPIQVSCRLLQYHRATMDYFLSGAGPRPRARSAITSSVAAAAAYALCYQPPEYMPVVSPLPAEKRACLLGCLNNLSRLTKVLALWGEVTRAVPGRSCSSSRALDDAQPLALANVRAPRIAPVRLELRGFVPIDQAPAIYAAIDIALDPFPFAA